LFEQIISLENLFLAWREFKEGKHKRPDVCFFEKNLRGNILDLHNKLSDKTYKHSEYVSFYVNDPKLRKIHKAPVRDRVLHHAIFRILYPIFDKLFICDSYSCRVDKGTHRAVKRFNYFARKVGRNNTKACFVLKCDVRKFFDSISQDILTSLIKRKIKDEATDCLIEEVIKSFPAGLPLGNITSQLFANIYLNELDKFVKYKIGIKYYLRYCDDFLILDNDKLYLKQLIKRINSFLKNNLGLSLHPGKVVIRRYNRGVDFLGYVGFPQYGVLRTKTKNRMFIKINKKIVKFKSGEITKESLNQAIQSYFGALKHCDSHKLKEKVADLIGKA
jgi:retron-type reverse transcriptase